MRRNWLVWLALLAAVAGIFYGITAGALWEPYEVRVAELGRRIALNLLGGGGLGLPETDNSLPIRADLGRGELPFTSIGLGLRLFGLSAWAGRLPLVAWSLVGLGALYLALSRLVDRRLALWALLALATTPLYFLQARTLLGDGVTLGAFTLCWSGLSVACLAEGLPKLERTGFALAGAMGAYAGFWCRGPIVSVAAPLLSVGVAGLLARPREALSRWLTLGASVVGVLALVLGVRGLALAESSGDYSVLVGSRISVASQLPTFDVGLGELAHAAYPWSATAPLWLPLLVEPRGGPAPERALIDAAALGLITSLAASAWLAPWIGVLVLPSVCCLSVLVALALRKLETFALGSPLVGLAVAALSLLIGLDLRENLDKTLSGFGLRGAVLPEGLQAAAGWFWLCGAALLGVVAALCLYDAEPDRARGPLFELREYRRVLRALEQAHDGNLVFALLLVEAGLLGFLVLCALSERVGGLPQLESFGSLSRKLVAVAAIVLPLAPLALVAVLLVRDAARFAFERARWLTRAEGLLLAFAALGLAASWGLYPELARQVSPKQAFESYRRLRQSGEKLAVLGEQGGAARYEGVPDAESFEQSAQAFDWLTQPGPRRFLVLRKSDLPELSAQYRALRQANLPILDARASEVLLGASRLLPEEHSQNPLDACVLERPPPIQVPLHAVLDDRLEVLGWSLRSEAGQLEQSLTPARGYVLSVYFRVLAPFTDTEWQSFVHIDGLQRRFNAAHQPLDGKYPLELWRPGDVLVDTTEVKLDPNFSPGAYRLYFGLFSGERRLPVTAGAESEDRVSGGVVQVR